MGMDSSGHSSRQERKTPRLRKHKRKHHEHKSTRKHKRRKRSHRRSLSPSGCHSSCGASSAQQLQLPRLRLRPYAGPMPQMTDAARALSQRRARSWGNGAHFMTPCDAFLDGAQRLYRVVAVWINPFPAVPVVLYMLPPEILPPRSSPEPSEELLGESHLRRAIWSSEELLSPLKINCNGQV